MKYRNVPDITKHIKKNIRRLPVILCEDISGSMQSKCDMMNEQLENFFSIKTKEPEICRRVELSVLKFNNKCVKETTTLNKYLFKRFTKNDFLKTTHLWGALNMALNLSIQYIDNPKYYNPFIILYTDGFPNNESENFKNYVLSKISSLENDNKIILFILGIGDANKNEELNCDILNNISKRKSKVVFLASEDGIDIQNFFHFMTKTITQTIADTRFFLISKDGECRIDEKYLDKLYDDYNRKISLC